MIKIARNLRKFFRNFYFTVTVRKTLTTKNKFMYLPETIICGFVVFRYRNSIIKKQTASALSLPIHVLWFIWETYLKTFGIFFRVRLIERLSSAGLSQKAINSCGKKKTFRKFVKWEQRMAFGRCKEEKEINHLLESNEWPSSVEKCVAWHDFEGVNLMMVFSFSQFPPCFVVTSLPLPSFLNDEMKSPAIKH